MEVALKQLIHHVRENAMLNSINALLNWDERTYMPDRAGDYRAEQITMMSAMAHQKMTDPRLKDWLDTLANHPECEDPASDVATIVRQVRRDYERQCKLPQRLVEELARVSVTGQRAWAEARQSDDFAKLAPYLDQIIRLKQEEAEAIGYEQVPYDALLDEYEPGAKTAEVRSILEGLREELVPLVQSIMGSDRKAPINILHRNVSRDRQHQFGIQAAEAIGFDFQRGRLDETAHPFCTEIGPHDCRILTRYDETFFPSAFFGTLHEAGHGIYEQGLRSDQYGLPTGTYSSLGIHESQSRLWENQVGRSRAFWQHFLPAAKVTFGDALNDVTLDELYFAVNHVEPSLIRVEADEATYNLHIIIRFEIEQELIDGQLAVADLPEAWNQKYEDYLGIKPPSDADGVMQDVHWPSTAIGYFATYSLGNLYAAQLYAKADEMLGGLDELIAKGEFKPLLDWLRKHVHQVGQNRTPTEMLYDATGETLSHEYLMAHLKNKLQPLYLG